MSYILASEERDRKRRRRQNNLSVLLQAMSHLGQGLSAAKRQRVEEERSKAMMALEQEKMDREDKRSERRDATQRYMADTYSSSRGRRGDDVSMWEAAAMGAVESTGADTPQEALEILNKQIADLEGGDPYTDPSIPDRMKYLVDQKKQVTRALGMPSYKEAMRQPGVTPPPTGSAKPGASAGGAQGGYGWLQSLFGGQGQSGPTAPQGPPAPAQALQAAPPSVGGGGSPFQYPMGAGGSARNPAAAALMAPPQTGGSFQYPMGTGQPMPSQVRQQTRDAGRLAPPVEFQNGFPSVDEMRGGSTPASPAQGKAEEVHQKLYVLYQRALGGDPMAWQALSHMFPGLNIGEMVSGAGGYEPPMRVGGFGTSTDPRGY